MEGEIAMPARSGPLAIWRWPWVTAIAVAAVTLSAGAAGPLDDVLGEKAAEAEPAETKGPSPEEQKTVREIEEAVGAGRYDEAIALAKTFVRNAESEALKTEATRLVAVAQRKKKDWDLAQAAYLTFRDRHAKGTDAYVRANAIVEVLRASRDGVYYPLVEQGDGRTARTLDDDAVLGEALACLARNRAERLQVRLAPLRRAGSVEELLKRFLPLAEDLRHVRLIWPEGSRTLDRAAIQTAAMRLEALSAPALAALKEKAAEFQALQRTRRLNTSQQSEMKRYRGMAEGMAAAEHSFLEAVHRLGGTADWPEGLKLTQEVSARRDAYAELAESLSPEPPRRDRPGDRGDANRWRKKGALAPS